MSLLTKTLTIFFLFTCYDVTSQVLPVTSQIFDQKFSYVPSFAGLNDYSTFSLSSQKQWIGIKNSPYTFIAAFNGRLGNFDFYNPKGLLNRSGLKTKDRLGFGIELFTDQAGFVRNNGVKLAMAYHYPIGKNKLSFGYAVGLKQQFYQNSGLKPYYADDPMVPGYNETNYFFNYDMGLSFSQPYNFYSGVAVHNLFNSRGILQKKINISDYFRRGYLVSGGKFFRIHDRNFEAFIQSSLFGNEGINSLAGLRYFFRKGSWISVIENNNLNEISGNLALLYRKTSFAIGYSYFTGTIQKYQKGSLEFSIITRIGDLSRIRYY